MRVALFLLLAMVSIGCDPTENPETLFQLASAQVSGSSLLSNDPVPVGDVIVLAFTEVIEASSASDISLITEQQAVDFEGRFLDDGRTYVMTLSQALLAGTTYTLSLPMTIMSTNGSRFPGVDITFTTQQDILELVQATVGGTILNERNATTEIDFTDEIVFSFNYPLDQDILSDNLQIVGNRSYTYTTRQITDTEIGVTLDSQPPNVTKVNLLLPSTIGQAVDRTFETLSYAVYTSSVGEPDFPTISDEELLTLVQERTFEYFWAFGHEASGLARERNTSGSTVTTGGSGFGLMAMIVGVERGFITRVEAVQRWQTVMDFLEGADRFHGVWAHWYDGNTGRALPFSEFDNGGDIVETAFLVQGMLTVRQYLNDSDPTEAALIEQITRLWEGVEWNWYARPGTDYITWHWSPEHEWRINLPVRGHNETQIIYTLAAASPTFPIDSRYYQTGYQRNGNYVNGNTFYGIELPTGPGRGGPLFFSHYSYIGMDPRQLNDGTIDYWQQNINHTLINRAYCIDNPRDYVGYSEDCWGLTASDGDRGYSAHDTNNDRGVITPTAAISSIPYTPAESMAAIRFFYFQLGDRLWGDYGFYDAFNLTEGWTANSYLAIDQGPIVCMIENHRTGLLWDLYMSAPEVRAGLDNLGITY